MRKRWRDWMMRSAPDGAAGAGTTDAPAAPPAAPTDGDKPAAEPAAAGLAGAVDALEADQATEGEAAADGGQQADQSKDDESGGDGKTPEADPDDAVPEGELYDLTPPEGFDALDEQTLRDASPILKRYGVGAKGAQELTDIIGAHVRRNLESAMAEGARAQAAEATADEQRATEELTRLGYEGYDPQDAKSPANVDAARGALEVLLDRSEDAAPREEQIKTRILPMLERLDELGAAPIIKPMLAAIGKRAAADTFTAGSGQRQRTAAEILYPNDTPR